MAQRLTSFSKLLITALILALIFFGGKFLLENTGLGDKVEEVREKEKQERAEGQREKENNKGSESSNSGKASSDNGGLFNKDNNKRSTASGEDVLRVQLVTWPGYAPGLYFNEGAEASINSRFYKEYGFKVEFRREDDLINALNAWFADEYDVLVQTADAFPLYTSVPDVMDVQPRAFIQTDWSRGGDAIIAKRGINSINDLKGKRIAIAVPAPAQTMLISALESAGMNINDVTLVKTTDNIAAAEQFQSPDVDAAVVWSPFDIEATSKVPGSKILLTTKEQSHIIGDIMFAKESVMRQKRDMFNGFYEGWMKAVAEINASQSNKRKAAKYLGEFLQLPTEDALGAMTTVHYASHGDNMNFFGLNNSYRGMSGENLYSTMNKKFAEMGDSEGEGPNWRNVIDTRAILSGERNLQGQQYAAEGAKEFKPATARDKTVASIASKPVKINFATGKSALTENMKTIIDLEFAGTAKSFGNMRVRVEGNTDNVGNRAMNQKLSEARARSVAEYLGKTYQMDPNRFIIVGNGPDRPVKGCEANQNESCKAKNRRTEFQLIPG